MNIITAYRKQKKISMQVLATRAGVHINTIWRLEHGTTMPSSLTIQKLSRATKIPVEELF